VWYTQPQESPFVSSNARICSNCGLARPNAPLTLVKTYPVCAASGVLGPKRHQGDEQVPEGFYHVRRFNPESTYHLSLGIDYPNESDSNPGNEPYAAIYIFTAIA